MAHTTLALPQACNQIPVAGPATSATQELYIGTYGATATALQRVSVELCKNCTQGEPTCR